MITAAITVAVETTSLTVNTVGQSPTVTSSAAFGSVAAGQKVYGPGIRIGTSVKSKESASSITLSEPAFLTATGAAVRFGYSTNAAYTDGDVLGFPVRVPLSCVKSVVINDKAKTTGATGIELYFFTKPWVTPTVDNAAFAPSDADALSICGLWIPDNRIVLTDQHIITFADDQLPPMAIGAQELYCQCVATAADDYTASTDLTLVFTGE